VDTVKTIHSPVTARVQARQNGFGLIEAMVAGIILIVGLAALAGLFAQSLNNLQYTREDLIAKQKAREALEAVYTARNDSTIGFAGIQNVNNGGIFLNGFQPLFLPGPNGVVGTAGQSAILDRQVLPGPDGIIGTADDVILPLNNFQRQILIQPLFDANGNISPDIRQITVTVQVTSEQRGTRNYTVSGYISRFQ
jgi:type II secretory pathway pseudopilin PulG